MKFGGHIHLQKYVEINGSIAFLKSNTVKQIVGLKKYMCMLSDQDRPAAQKNNHLYHISGNQLFKLTACDMMTALVNEKLENQESCTTSASPMPHYTSPSSSVPMRSPILWEHTPFKKGLKPDDPPQNVDNSHLSDSANTNTNLNETNPLDTSCEHLLHLDSPSLSSEPRDNSSAESSEIESLSGFEEHLNHSNLSPTEVFIEHHDYELFLLQKEVDTPYDNLSHQDTHVCEEQGEDDLIIHATHLSHKLALPQFMAKHKCEDLNPTGTPSTVPTAIQASSDHTLYDNLSHQDTHVCEEQGQDDLIIHATHLSHKLALPS